MDEQESNDEILKKQDKYALSKIDTPPNSL
jgi:hypothetical protein